MVNLPRNRVCFDVPEDVARTVRRLSDPEARATALLAHFTARPGQTHHTYLNRTTDAPASPQSAVAERAQGAFDAAISHMEAGPLTLHGRYIYQGNGNGAVTNRAGTVLFTSDLGPCVAVCGYNGNQSFMIHSDSTGTRGSGVKDLISGIRKLVSIGTGDGWTISLIGGSTAGTSAYLKRSENLPGATIHDLGESEGAYITETGMVASSKRRLARSLQASEIFINAPAGGIPDTAPTVSRMFGSRPGAPKDHIPATADRQSDAAGVEVDRQQTGAVVDSERQTLTARIADEFGVRIDSSAGLKAVRDTTAPDTPMDEMDKVQPLRWEQFSLEQVYAALKHYAPVLGPQRTHSNRAGSDQEVETIGSVTSGLFNKKAMPQLAGAYFEHLRLVNVYKSGHKVDRLGSNPEQVRLNSVEWVVSHEMAHGLLNYALRDFTKKFWEGIEPPLKVDGYVASSPAEDFREAIRIVLQGPKENLRFALRSPRHAKAMGTLRARLPEAFFQRAGESPSDAAARIAEELKGELPSFIRGVSTTWTPGGDRFFGKEAPISAYARTNADEDLAETAMYFFNDGPYLWKHAPERAAFVNDLVTSWTKATDPRSEDHHADNTDAPHMLAQERGAPEGRPRFVVRSGFDARRFSFGGERFTDLTVRLAFRGGEGERAVVRHHVEDGVEALLNKPSYRLPHGDRLHVTVEFVDAFDDPHLTVDLVSRDRAMDQSTWWVDAGPARLAHELTHQLGLRDEYRDAASPDRTPLLGAPDEMPEDASLAMTGLHDRHLALIDALVGEVTPHAGLSGRSWESARAAAEPVLRQAVWVSPVSLTDGVDNADEVASGSRIGADGPRADALAVDGTGRPGAVADAGSVTESGPGFAALWNVPRPPSGQGAAETAPESAPSATADGAGFEPTDVVADVLWLRAMASNLLELHSHRTGADLRSREGARRLEEAFLGDAQAQLIMRLLAERSPDGDAVDAAARGFVREWLSRRLGVDAGLPDVGVRPGDRLADAAPEEEIGADLFDVRGHGVGTGDLFVSASGRLVHADGPRLQHADMSADFAVNRTAAFVTGNDPVHRTGEFAVGWTSADVRRAAVQVLEDPDYEVPDLENPGRSIRSGTVGGVGIDVTVTTEGKIASVRRSQIVRFDQGRHGLSREGERNLNLIADRLAALAARNSEAGFPPPLVTVRGTGTRGGPLALADTRRIDAVGAYLERATRVVGIDLNVVRRHAGISARQAERFGPYSMGLLRRQVAVTIDSHASHIGRRAIRLLDGQAESDRRRRLTDLFPVPTPRSVPAQSPISAEDQARIVYSEAAQDFERRLGHFLVHHPPVVQFVHDLIGRLWNLVQDEAPHLLARFGTRDPHRPGAVGNDPAVLQSTVESGNLREQMAMLWNGHDNALFDVLFDRPSVFPMAIEIERGDRRAVANADALRQLTVREADIVPPLSHREREFSGIPESDAVVWRLASTVMDYPLESDLQLAGSRTGALISTGTSGSTYVLLRTAEDLALRTGTPIRMDLMRLALLGNMLATRTHTFHEVMSSAQLWDTERGGRYGLRYADNWGRYHRLDPVDEETLRRDVAHDGLFPDEIAFAQGHPWGIREHVQPEEPVREVRGRRAPAEPDAHGTAAEGMAQRAGRHTVADAADNESVSGRDGLRSRPAWESGERPGLDTEVSVSVGPDAPAGVVSAPPVQGSPEDGRMAALRKALRSDLLHAVRPWEGSFDEEVARLQNILQGGGSRSIVFGNWDEAPVWVVKMDETNSLGWFDRYFRPLPDGPSFAHGPVASIDIGHSGALVGPSLPALLSLDREATEGTKLAYCDMGPGYDFTNLFTRNVPW